VYNPQETILTERQDETITPPKPPRVAVNIDAIPTELKDRKQWVYWRYELTQDRDEWTKLPVNVKTGSNASSTKPDQWASFDEAIANHRFRKDEVDGIGFVFVESDPFVGIDLDDCIDPVTGAVEAWAASLIAKTASYAEISPSGRGVKLFCRGTFPAGEDRTGRKSGDIEVYRSARFFTMTGCHLDGAPPTIEDGQAGIDAIFADHLSSAAGKNGRPVYSDTAFQTQLGAEEEPPVWPNVTDEEILCKARSAGGAQKFISLYDEGDISPYGNDKHPGDFALISRLAFWCGRDPARIDRLFRGSQLMRKKWDRPWRSSTYGRVSILRVLETKEDFFDWTREKAKRDKATDPSPQFQGEDEARSADDRYPETDPGIVLPKKKIIVPEDVGWPMLRDEALYGLPGDIARTIFPHTEADMAGLLINILIMFGNAAGPWYHAYADGSRHGLNLFVVTVGETNAGKGTATGHARSFMRNVDSDWNSNCNASGLSSGEGLIAELTIPENQDCPEAPRRLQVVESELGGTLTVMKREGNSLSSIIRQLFDGDVASTMTKNPMRAKGAHTSFIGHITPLDLEAHLTRKDAFNGFANRFLWLLVRRSKELPNGGGQYDGSQLVARLQVALQFARQQRDPVWRDAEAEVLWSQVYRRISATREGVLDAILARARPLCLRLSLLYAAMDCSPVIGRRHLEAALAIWDYCEASAKRIFAGHEIDYGQRIYLAVRSSGAEGMSQTDITVALGRNISAAVRDAELDSLVRNRVLVVQSVKAKNGKYIPRYYAADQIG
jgi:Protein of unknown function (DUF3987)